MSQQALDLRRSLQIVRRHKILVTVAAVLGLLAGVGSGLVSVPMFGSQALVVLAPSVRQTRTQVVIASSDPVLAGAVGHVDRSMSVATLRSHIEVKSLAYNVLSIGAQGRTAAQAERTANAVAASYVDYLGAGRMPGGVMQARVLEAATDASETSIWIHLFVTGGLGALGGLLIGAVTALGISRTDRRLRERDEIAESVGLPVLASVLVRRPSDTAGWRKLLEGYQPSAVDAWRMRKALQDLDLVEGNGNGSSLTVLSLSSDPKAVALGPQLAVFAASLGIPTVLMIGPQQDANATATLRAACAAAPESPGLPGQLRVTVGGSADTCRPGGAALTVVVAVLDGNDPKAVGPGGAGTAILGVSAGAATAEQLARVAAAVAASGQHIAGIFVADPDPADHTSGRLPHLALPVRQIGPMTATGTARETDR